MKREYRCLPRQSWMQGDYSLSPVQDEHIESIRQWRNAQMDVLRQQEVITSEAQVAYYERHIWPDMEVPEPANILFSFFREQKLIGYGGLVHIAWTHRRAELSFLLEPACAGNIEGYQADFGAFIGLMKEVAFAGLDLHRLWTETYDLRPLHIAVLEANGLQLEGIMRDHVMIDNQPVNALIHGILNEK